MENQVVLITGANKGLGLETARQIGKEGHSVVIGSRDHGRGLEAANSLKEDGVNVELLELDLQDSESVDNAVNYVSDKHGKLDILINNAGAVVNEDFMQNTVETVSIEDLKKTFDINFFSTIEITRKFLPLVRKSSNGKIINLSSILGSLTTHLDEESPLYGAKPFAYNSSKTALNQFGVHLAHALKDENIKVFSAHPGWVQTDMGGEQAPLTVVEGAKTMVDLALGNTDFKSGSYVHLDSILPW